jgi:2-octaprenyl-6-methoxyphenol hydroxylase
MATMLSSELKSVAVLGAGPVGLATALALATHEMDVLLVAPPVDTARLASERRTAALFGSSIDFLENLGVWTHCAAASAPIRTIRIADAREGLVHAPEMAFHAREIGRETFGSNIPNATLVKALADAAMADDRITWIPTSGATTIARALNGIRIELAEGHTVFARLLAAADGRGSIAPQAAGISVHRWTYPQIAIAATFHHSRPHRDTVIELHGAHGPFTTVPLVGDSSSLVWVESPDTARALLDVDAEAFADQLEERLQGVLGTVGNVGPRASYPLSALTASRMGASAIALVGEAAHVLPPIGAQGLNLGLRDAAALAECVADARTRGADIAGDDVLQTYHLMRSTDVATRSASIDALNRSLLADMLPVDVLRSLTARLIAGFHPLRQLLMYGGMGYTGHLPRLMRRNAPPPAP